MADGVLEHPGDYKLPNIILIPSHGGDGIEIKNMVIELNIYEDIYNNAVTGTIGILDSTNLIQTLPLTGTETLAFKLVTPGAEGDANLIVDATETTGYPFHIYKLTDRRQVKEGPESYVLHFTSRELFRNIRTRVSQAYNGSLDLSARRIFTDKLGLDGRKKFVYEPTRNSDKVVIPNMHPFDAINLLASKALSKNGNSAGYLFYETTKAFYFRSFENMLANQTVFSRKEELELKFSPKNVGAGKGKSKSVYSKEYNQHNVDSYSFTQHYDTITQQALGTYGSNVIMHNIYDKTYTETPFNYHKYFSEEYHADRTSSKRGSQLHYPVTKTPVDEDGLSISEYPNSRIILSPTTRYLHNKATGKFGTSEEGEGLTEARMISRDNQTLSSNILQLQLPGHSYVEAGDVIKFDLPSQEPRKGAYRGHIEDDYHSGRYVIMLLRHQIQKEGHLMVLDCVKDSVANPYPEEEEYQGAIKKRAELVDVYEDDEGKIPGNYLI